MPDFLDPASLMRIRSLELRAKVVVEGFWHGLHRSPYHGFSVEFSEYRQYAPGDDIRHVDWRVYARTDRHYIKKYEDETNLRCQLLVDCSKSMGYGSDGLTKAQYGATLAATLTWFLNQQGDAVGLTTFDDKIVDYLPPRNRPGHLRRLMLLLEKEAVGTSTEFGVPLQRVAEMHDRRGLFVLVSDLLAPLEELSSRLGYLRARGHDLVLFHVLDPREFDFEFEKSAQFLDLESGQQFFINPAAAKKEYTENFNTHLEAIETLCSRQGIEYIRLKTTDPLDLALHDFLTTRMKQKASPLRTVRNA
jgi:uncharacterized protein (DUF58 family)